MTKTLVFYHGKDFDGLCSGAVVKFFIPSAELRPINYGNEFPMEECWGNIVYMCDYSLQPFERMIELAKTSTLCWIDHHLSAKLDYEKQGRIIVGLREIGTAACELTWNYFTKQREKPPAGIHLLSRYDTWDLDEAVLQFQYGMRAIQPPILDANHPVWREIIFSNLDILEVMNEGRTILRYKAYEDARTMQNSFVIDFDGLRTLCVNVGFTTSQMFEPIYNPDEHDLMLAFALTKRGLWTVSLRSTKDHIDCSIIAKKYGGGGHKQAAGFQTKELFFL